MVDFGSIYPDEEDIKLAFDRSMSIIDSELQNLKEIMKRSLEGKAFVSAEKCAEIFHCPVSEIPQALPRYRGSRSYYLYKISEIYDFIEERRIPRKS